MASNQQVLDRIDRLVARGNELLSQKTGDIGEEYVPKGSFVGWRASVLNFLTQETGERSAYTAEFSERVKTGDVDQIEQGISILSNLRIDIDYGDFTPNSGRAFIA